MHFRIPPVASTVRLVNDAFKSLTEGIDTTSPGGRLLFHLLGAIAQFERDLIGKRTRAGLEAARARGRRGGRPKAMDDTKLSVAREMY